MEQAATLTLRDLQDATKFSVEKAAAVFGPNIRYVFDHETGKYTDKIRYEVKDSDLEEICRKSNATAKKGHFGRQTIGHVRFDGTAEKDQPAKLVGHPANYRVGELPDGSKVILADLYTSKGFEEEAKKYPYRSAEYRIDSKTISGVARLLRDPELMLGTISYSSPVACYGDVYSESMDKISGKESDRGTPDGMKPGGDLSPDEMVAADRIFEYLVCKFPQLKSLKADGELGDQKPEAPDNTKAALEEMEEEKEDGDEEDGDAGDEKDDKGNTKKKSVKGKAFGKDKKSKSGKTEIFQMSAIVDTGEKGVSVEVYSALEAKFNTLSESHAKLFQEGERFKVERMLDKLDIEKYQFDRDEAVSVMLPRDEAGRLKFVDFIKKSCKQVKQDQVEVYQGPNEGGPGTGVGISKEHYDRAISFMVKEGVTDMAKAIAATKAS
jgi:hypothetical protein